MGLISVLKVALDKKSYVEVVRQHLSSFRLASVNVGKVDEVSKNENLFMWV